MKNSVLLLVLSFLLSINMFGQSGITSEMFKIDNNFDKHNEMLNSFLEKNNNELEFWRLDSTVTYGMIEDNDSIAYRKEILTYNDVNNTLDRASYLKIPDQDEEWQNYTRNLMTFNDNNQQIQLLWFNGNEQTWELLYKDEFVYNSDNNIVSNTGCNWDRNNEVWRNSFKTEYYYNNMGLLTLDKKYQGDFATNNWVNLRKTEIIYNSDNKELMNTILYWDKQNSIWNNGDKETFSYEGGIMSSINYKWDSIEWKLFEKTDGSRISSYKITYNSYSYINDSIWLHDKITNELYSETGDTITNDIYIYDEFDSIWYGYSKRERIYNEQDQQIESISYKWVPENLTWINSNKSGYGYNENGIGYYRATYGWKTEENIWIKGGSDISYFSNPSSIYDNNANYTKIQINPNPCTNQIAFDYDTKTSLNAVYTIFLLSGRVVDKGIIKKGNIVDVSELDIGYYILKLEVGAKRYSGKFLKL